MGHGDDVGSVHQAVGGEVRHIGRHPAGVQGRQHGVVIHDLSPGQVDEPDAPLHGADGLGVDHVLGLLGVVDVDGDIVRPLIQLVDVLHHVDVAVQPQGGVHGEIGVVAVHVHAQGQGDVGYQRADGAQTDDAQGLFIQLRPDKGRLALFHHGGHIHAGGHLLPHPLDAPVHIPGAHQHGAQHQLLHGVGVGAGGVEYHDALLRAAVQGNVVDAGPRPGNGQEILRKVIVQKLGGADQDGVLVRHRIRDGVQRRIQAVQADRRDLVECFDAVHGRMPPLGGPSGPRYLRGNVRCWHRFRRSIFYYRSGRRAASM